MKTLEMTFPEEITLQHIEYCNKVQKGFKAFSANLFKYPIGAIVTSKNAHPVNIIGVVCGYVFCPITNSYRAILGINCDLEIDNLELANDKEIRAFDLFTNDFKPVERRMTCLI